MHIERFGSGSRFFLALHGWSGDSRTFHPIARLLPDDVTLLCADLPGCGSSPKPPSLTLEDVLDEIVAAVHQIAEPVTVVGTCTGANLAFFLALRAPARIRRVVAVEAFSFWPWYFRIFLNPIIGRPAYRTTFANPLGRFLANLGLSSKRAQSSSLTDGFRKVDHKVTYRYLELFRNAGGIEQFKQMAAPVDLVYGKRSFKAIHESARHYQELWPHARTCVLDNAGHLPIQEAPEKLCEILFDLDLQESLCPKRIMSYEI